MACNPMVGKTNGVPWVGMICGPKARRRACSVCGKPSSKLCDFVEQGDLLQQSEGTCDAPLCTKCARHESPDMDFCPTHPA